MIRDCMYIELKTGYSDDGPAWIGYVKTSKTRKTIYFNDHAFQKSIGSYSNYIDIENGDEYWISGLKKGESNRHWAGHGKNQNRPTGSCGIPCVDWRKGAAAKFI